jgi:hypothetical protein
MSCRLKVRQYSGEWAAEPDFSDGGHAGKLVTLRNGCSPSPCAIAARPGEAAAVLTLGGEYVGLVDIDDGEWDVYFGPLRLGRFPERTYLIEDIHGRHRRRTH